jgi:FMN phosphatase YigB (HAD superfamily)
MDDRVIRIRVNFSFIFFSVIPLNLINLALKIMGHFTNRHLGGLEAVIFDLGGVVIDLHYERTASVLAERAGITMDQIGDLLVTSDVLKRFEIGQINESTFRAGVCEVLGIEMEDGEFDVTWNALLGEVSNKRVEAMMDMRSHVKTLVLSNTNSIHEQAFNQHISEAHNIEGVHGLVDKAYLSHDLKMRKPDVSTYQEVIVGEGLYPGKTLFRDDRGDSAQVAQPTFSPTFHNKKIDDWIDFLKP